MNIEKKPEEIDAAGASTEEQTEKKAEEEQTTTQEPSQENNPLKKELDKIERQKSGKSELEKAEFKRQQIDKRIAELKGESKDAPNDDDDTDDNRPLTVSEFRKLEQEKENRRAVDLADSIEDETERKLTIHYLENSIRPSGNADVDLANARAIVNSKRNAQIAEEAGRITKPSEHGATPGSPGKPPEGVFEPTPEEASLMRAPFNLSKEDIIAAREREEAKRG